LQVNVARGLAHSACCGQRNKGGGRACQLSVRQRRHGGSLHVLEQDQVNPPCRLIKALLPPDHRSPNFTVNATNANLGRVARQALESHPCCLGIDEADHGCGGPGNMVASMFQALRQANNAVGEGDDHEDEDEDEDDEDENDEDEDQAEDDEDSDNADY
jgi:hypothetical protein